MTDLPDIIYTQKHIENATIRVYRNEADPDWVDISIADGYGHSHNPWDHIATLTQEQLAKLIEGLQRHQLDNSVRP